MDNDRKQAIDAASKAIVEKFHPDYEKTGNSEAFVAYRRFLPQEVWKQVQETDSPLMAISILDAFKEWQSKQ